MKQFLGKLFKGVNGWLRRYVWIIVSSLLLWVALLGMHLSAEQRSHMVTQSALNDAQLTIATIERKIQRMELERSINEAIRSEMEAELAKRESAIAQLQQITSDQLDDLRRELNRPPLAKQVIMECADETPDNHLDITRRAAAIIADGMWSIYEESIRPRDSSNRAGRLPPPGL